MPEAPVTVERSDGIAVVTLNRPAALNAVSAALRDCFIQAMRALNADAAVRAVVITGAGPRAFSAGFDLDESARMRAEDVEPNARALRNFYQAVRDMEKPTVAALNGIAAGAGFQVALHSDMRVAHPEVRMTQPELNAGLPSIIGSMIMREVLGLSRTAEMALSCRQLDADECLSLGLVNEIVERDRVLPRAIELAGQLAAMPPVAVRLTKARVREITQQAYDDAIEAAIVYQRQAYEAGEPQAAARAFLARRKGRH